MISICSVIMSSIHISATDEQYIQITNFFERVSSSIHFIRLQWKSVSRLYLNLPSQIEIHICKFNLEKYMVKIQKLCIA